MDSLERKLEAKVEGMVSAAQPVSEEAKSAGATLEAQIVDEIRAFGLDDKDFDWNPAAELFAKNDETGVRNYFRDQIKSHLEEQSTSERRQTKKETQQESPDPSSVSKNTDAGTLGDKSKSFEERYAALQKMTS